jgi:hypothetical protein
MLAVAASAAPPITSPTTAPSPPSSSRMNSGRSAVTIALASRHSADAANSLRKRLPIR